MGQRRHGGFSSTYASLCAWFEWIEFGLVVAVFGCDLLNVHLVLGPGSGWVAAVLVRK